MFKATITITNRIETGTSFAVIVSQKCSGDTVFVPAAVANHAALNIGDTIDASLVENKNAKGNATPWSAASVRPILSADALLSPDQQAAILSALGDEFVLWTPRQMAVEILHDDPCREEIYQVQSALDALHRDGKVMRGYMSTEPADPHPVTVYAAPWDESK